jgi:non-ribosomal peptide synthetase component E (peptide arylation enzyme)
MFLNALKQQALQYPDQTALRGETTLWSWKQYLEAVVNAASLLHALGIRRLALER